MSWPHYNGPIKKMKLRGDVITRTVPGPYFWVNGSWDGNLDDRKIDTGKSEVLEIEFYYDADPYGERYSFEADFGGWKIIFFRQSCGDTLTKRLGRVANSITGHIGLPGSGGRTAIGR